MNPIQRYCIGLCGVAALVFVTGCSNMSSCEKGAAVGAGLGGVAGSVLTGGDTVGTVGGAVAGGVVGANRKGC
jgi:osmotically inducible lipoprotein OsmB